MSPIAATRPAATVTLTPVIMKKSRPGVILSCLVAHEHFNAAMDVLFRETTALGVRYQSLVRQVLPRRFDTVKVRGGSVQVKIAVIFGISQYLGHLTGYMPRMFELGYNFPLLVIPHHEILETARSQGNRVFKS